MSILKDTGRAYTKELLKEKTPPCKIGDVLTVRIDGHVRDPFTKYLGFMLFIKDVPLEMREVGNFLKVEIIGIGKTYGFAMYLEEE